MFKGLGICFGRRILIQKSPPPLKIKKIKFFDIEFFFQVDKTTWDWELCNQSKPIWTRKPAEIEESEYDEFYKSITKDKSGPLTKIHFVAEGKIPTISGIKK